MPAPFYSRRDFLRASAAMALVPRIGAANQHDGFSFVVLSDLHYRDARCGSWFERVVAHIRALRPAPAFCVLNGDLAESGRRDQLGAVRDIFRPLPMPLYAVIGNHDCAEDGSRHVYEELYGKKANAQFDHGDCQFLLLDTIEGTGVYRTRIARETLAWVDQTLPQLKRDRPLIVLTHFPLGRNWLRPLNAKVLLGRLHRHNLQAVLSGHWHGLTERVDEGTSLATGRCSSWWRTNHDGSKEKGYLICNVRDGQVTHRFQPVGF